MIRFDTSLVFVFDLFLEHKRAEFAHGENTDMGHRAKIVVMIHFCDLICVWLVGWCNSFVRNVHLVC